MAPRFAPFWYDRFPASRRTTFPSQRGDIETDVVIVGGGLAGCACAFACAAARIPVVLLEAERVGLESGGGAAGLIGEDFDARFTDAVKAYGLRTARLLWQGLRRASLDLPAALRRLEIRCDLSAQDVLRVAAPDPPAAKQLRREYEARRAAGFDHRWIRGTAIARDMALEAAGAIRTRGSVVDPYRACVGLARAAAERGAALFETSAVRRIRASRRGVDVTTSAGRVHAERVVVTGAASIPDLRPLRRHLRPRHGYAVVTEALPAAVRRQLGRRALAVRDTNAPSHLVRWLKDDRVLIEGADQDPVASRSRPQVLVQRTGQLMYELSLLYPAISGTRAEWGWSFPFDDTADGLPYVGPHRSFPRHLFAFGLARHGAGAAWLAARILFRHLNGELARGDDAYGFSRIL